jgi:hypothetical protein
LKKALQANAFIKKPHPLVRGRVGVALINLKKAEA